MSYEHTLNQILSMRYEAQLQTIETDLRRYLTDTSFANTDDQCDLLDELLERKALIYTKYEALKRLHGTYDYDSTRTSSSL